MSSIGERYPVEQKRLRDLLKDYQAIGPAGAFGCLVIERALTEAEQAIASGDIVRIVSAYETMTTVTE